MAVVAAEVISSGVDYHVFWFARCGGGRQFPVIHRDRRVGRRRARRRVLGLLNLPATIADIVSMNTSSNGHVRDLAKRLRPSASVH